VAFCKDLPPNLNMSHYGFPNENTMIEKFVAKLPTIDTSQLFGFNRTIDRSVSKQKSMKLIQMIYQLNKNDLEKTGLGYSDLDLDLENTSMKISLAKSSLQNSQSNKSQFLQLAMKEKSSMGSMVIAERLNRSFSQFK